MSQVYSIILAAGGSTRMKSPRSKLLHSVLGRPLIIWSIDQSHWISEDVTLVVGHQKEEIQKICEQALPGSRLSFAHQKEQKGTAHAVLTALEVMNEKPEDMIFIMAGDACGLKKETLEKALEEHRSKAAVMTVLSSHLAPPHDYGRILRGAGGAIERIVEAKDATQDQLQISEFNSGFYFIQSKILRESLQQIKSENSKKEFYLTDLVRLLRARSLFVHTVGIEYEEALGVNTQVDLAVLTKFLQARVNRYWMSEGVQLQDPNSIWIEPTVEIEPGTFLGAGVHLKGKTKIGPSCSIGPYAVVENTELEAGTVIEPFSHLSGARLGKEVSVGPFARLRPGAILEDEVYIGNFVEVKKSHLHRGVKSGHLTYLGDATIGENTNIGAGTITCNYDGFSKYETKLGKNVFVGSNTSLVAPVAVGDGAIIGAGSVITKDVGSDSIALERSEQSERKGMAKVFRERKAKK